MNPIRVIKIGGSLLQRESLPADLLDYQALLVEPLVNVWVVGGGVAVDTIRARDRVQALSADDAHWSSIEAMDTNGMLLASRLPDWWLTDDHADPLKAASQLLAIACDDRKGQAVKRNSADCPAPQNFILQTKNWLIEADKDPDVRPRLPQSWEVTSDSIAAWAAIQLHAIELVLLKSCDIPNVTIAELAGLGIVDAHLPTFSLRRPPFRFVCQQLPYSVY